jgi:hypothetical protein
VKDSCEETINQKQASQILGISQNAFGRVAARAGLRVIDIPGTHKRYFREEVSALLTPIKAGEQRQAVAS